MAAVLDEQIRKVAERETSQSHLELKYRNGVIATFDTIDEVVSQENIGPATVHRRKLQFVDAPASPAHLAYVEFVNVDEESGEAPITVRYNVKGESRDWVFVTSSLIEERIKLVRRFAPNQIGGQALRLMLPFLMVVGILVSFTTVQRGRHSTLPLVEAAWREGALTDPIKALIMIEQAKLTVTPIEFLWRPFAWIAGILATFTLILMFFVRYYPVYVFNWGDYNQVFESRERTRKYVLSVVIVGLIVSVAAGLIVTKLA